MLPSQYRTEAKIYKAKDYLAKEELSVADISDRLGFTEVSYFIKVFKNSVGMTPTKYRTLHREKIGNANTLIKKA